MGGAQSPPTFLGGNPGTKGPNETTFSGTSGDSFREMISAQEPEQGPAPSRRAAFRNEPKDVRTRMSPAVAFRARKTVLNLNVHLQGLSSAHESTEPCTLKPRRSAIILQALNGGKSQLVKHKPTCKEYSGVRRRLSGKGLEGPAPACRQWGAGELLTFTVFFLPMNSLWTCLYSAAFL